MDVIFEGALSRSWSMHDVLKAVMGVGNPEYAILRISSPGSQVIGRMVISACGHVISAVASDGNSEHVDTGYAAVRRLLAAKDGNFAFLNTGGQIPPELPITMYLSVDSLISRLPQLPADPSEFFDQKSLLDIVFGPPSATEKNNGETSCSNEVSFPTNATIGLPDGRDYSRPPANQQAPGKKQQREETERPQATPINRDWQIFQPLLGNAAIAHPRANSLARIEPVAPAVDAKRPLRESLNLLRAQPEPTRPWYSELLQDPIIAKSSLIFAGSVLILSLVATLFGTAAVNRHPSLTIQKSASARTEPWKKM